MQLYYLDRKGPAKTGETQSMIVRAKTEESAREQATSVTGERDWTLTHKTFCSGVYFHGEEGILIRDVVK